MARTVLFIVQARYSWLLVCSCGSYHVVDNDIVAVDQNQSNQHKLMVRLIICNLAADEDGNFSDTIPTATTQAQLSSHAHRVPVVDLYPTLQRSYCM